MKQSQLANITKLSDVNRASRSALGILKLIESFCSKLCHREIICTHNNKKNWYSLNGQTCNTWLQVDNSTSLRTDFGCKIEGGSLQRFSIVEQLQWETLVFDHLKVLQVQPQGSFQSSFVDWIIRLKDSSNKNLYYTQNEYESSFCCDVGGRTSKGSKPFSIACN